MPFASWSSKPVMVPAEKIVLCTSTACSRPGTGEFRGIGRRARHFQPAVDAIDGFADDVHDFDLRHAAAVRSARSTVRRSSSALNRGWAGAASGAAVRAAVGQ